MRYFVLFFSLLSLATSVAADDKHTAPATRSIKSDAPKQEAAIGKSHLTKAIVAKPSKYSVAETIDRVETVAKAKGIVIFARIDHSGEAEKAGLSMRPTQLLILGNPKGGTPLMNAVPSLAIDLPMKVLAWQDSAGKVWAGYNSPAYMKERHGLTDEQAKPLGAVGGLIDAALQ